MANGTNQATDKKSPLVPLAGGKGMGGRRPGAGRPPGARNRITTELKELLAEADARGSKRLFQIIEKGTNREALEAIRLAWEYRHGKPKQEAEVPGATGGEQGGDRCLEIAGTKEEYIAGLRAARGE